MPKSFHEEELAATCEYAKRLVAQGIPYGLACYKAGLTAGFSASEVAAALGHRGGVKQAANRRRER